MSDEPTREIPDARSFEERVFARFDALDERTGRLETKVDALDERTGRLETKVDALDGRLTVLEQKVDLRLRETRLIWEAMQVRVESIEKDVKSLGRSILLLHEDNLGIRGDLRELLERMEKVGERVEKLESQSAR